MAIIRNENECKNFFELIEFDEDNIINYPINDISKSQFINEFIDEKEDFTL